MQLVSSVYTTSNVPWVLQYKDCKLTQMVAFSFAHFEIILFILRLIKHLVELINFLCKFRQTMQHV